MGCIKMCKIRQWLLKGAKYEFVGKKIKKNMESSREENQSIKSKEYIISW
jgi:hypothetical protein